MGSAQNQTKRPHLFTSGTIDDIRDGDFEWIVAITRGGMVPALQLSQALTIHRIDTFCMNTYTREPRIYYKAFAHLQGKRVLLVDDLADSGFTFLYTLDYLAREGVTDVKTAALYVKNKSKYHPHYYESRVNDDWITFPWETQNDG